MSRKRRVQRSMIKKEIYLSRKNSLNVFMKIFEIVVLSYPLKISK